MFLWNVGNRLEDYTVSQHWSHNLNSQSRRNNRPRIITVIGLHLTYNINSTVSKRYTFSAWIDICQSEEFFKVEDKEIFHLLCRYIKREKSVGLGLFVSFHSDVTSWRRHQHKFYRSISVECVLKETVYKFHFYRLESHFGLIHFSFSLSSTPLSGIIS
jgi:hypothetical protein